MERGRPVWSPTMGGPNIHPLTRLAMHPSLHTLPTYGRAQHSPHLLPLTIVSLGSSPAPLSPASAPVIPPSPCLLALTIVSLLLQNIQGLCPLPALPNVYTGASVPAALGWAGLGREAVVADFKHSISTARSMAFQMAKLSPRPRLPASALQQHPHSHQPVRAPGS